MQHQWPIRIYYEDTDAGGIVYHANYLKFFERARTEWLRALGIEQNGLLASGIAFVVRSVKMENYLPARFNELLQVNSQVTALKRASLTFHQQLLREGGQILCEAEVLVACVDLNKGKATAIPTEVLGVLKG
ncbi:tol-pal system-associated acyl-CoA thioesterase [Gallaecimonas xiamenensis]|uniref:Acyl-CoA thioester hydrolase YbgC n=1 Tax=Gallaecimonas xiamenensis 3-C-1 TaxID=745411 RepID=K2IGP4_9GAMM|nr:tol-pal system-associated acyl-CoA thioesterase [Gallaecimonas xiamenensis]EKE69246.1 tol-pal system-associated acyl-CoA thioesterase [Gallaecimonas xiamenensis 3-C-1]